MISFENIYNLNGEQLIEELRAIGVRIPNAEDGAVRIDGNNVLWLDISPDNKEKAQNVLNNHIPKPAPQLSVEEKLASVGLNLDDLKEALNL